MIKETTLPRRKSIEILSEGIEKVQRPVYNVRVSSEEGDMEDLFVNKRDQFLRNRWEKKKRIVNRYIL